ncbi:MAG TPA: hypothetical protein VEU51_03065 [Candidatus Acidoferrales bacterium]|nr:hypothetical protein [Candidatus Acidoferrales bacterium]
MPLVSAPTQINSGPQVALGDPIDARTTVGVGSLTATNMFGGDSTDQYIVGNDLALYANRLLEAQLASRGFRVLHYSKKAGATGSERVIVLGVVSARYDDTFWPNETHLITAPLRHPGAVEISITVGESSGDRVFSKHYYGTGGFNLAGSARAGPPENPVSRAVQDAIAKACDDPAFIAALMKAETSPGTRL